MSRVSCSLHSLAQLWLLITATPEGKTLPCRTAGRLPGAILLSGTSLLWDACQAQIPWHGLAVLGFPPVQPGTGNIYCWEEHPFVHATLHPGYPLPSLTAQRCFGHIPRPQAVSVPLCALQRSAWRQFSGSSFTGRGVCSHTRHKFGPLFPPLVAVKV